MEERRRSASDSGQPIPQMLMWHRFKNLVFSLQTYHALSPDLNVRRQVNQTLRQRPILHLDQWFQMFYQPQGIAYTVANFAYVHLANYSGLDFGRVLPSDRLNEDLHWSQICWFDWQVKLHEDFWQQFGVDISDCWDDSSLQTVKDLILLLNQYGMQAHQAE